MTAYKRENEMLSWKLSAMAAVVAWFAIDGEGAQAQMHYRYPVAAPVTRPYVPAAPAGRDVVPNCPNGQFRLRNNVPMGRYPANVVPSTPMGRPVYSPSVWDEAVPVRNQLNGSDEPVQFLPSVEDPYYRAPVNGPIAPADGNFSIDDDYRRPPARPHGVNRPQLPDHSLGSPFYGSGDRIVPTGGFAPVNEQPRSPVNAQPNYGSPFYE